MSINYDYYKVFYAVAKYGNVTKAAEHLHISQPTATYALKKLAEALNIDLFYRKHSGLKLTRSGELLYRYVKVAVESLENGEQQMLRFSQSEAGSISIGITDVLLEYQFIDMLSEYQDMYPDIRMNLFVSTNTLIEAQLQDNKSDCSLLIHDLALSGADEKFTMIPLNSFTSVIVVSNNYRDMYKGSLNTLEELSAIPLIGFTGDTALGTYQRQYFEKTGIEYSPSVELSSVGMFDYILASFGGYAIVPTFFAEKSESSGKLTVIKPAVPFPSHDIVLAINNLSLEIPCVQNLKDMITKELVQ